MAEVGDSAMAAADETAGCEATDEAAEDACELSVDDVGKVLKELVKIVDWYSLGTYLEVKAHILDAIERENPTIRLRMIKMLQHWLRTGRGCSWRKLVEALYQMGELAVTDNIRRKHLSLTTPVLPKFLQDHNSYTASPELRASIARKNRHRIASKFSFFVTRLRKQFEVLKVDPGDLRTFLTGYGASMCHKDFAAHITNLDTLALLFDSVTNNTVWDYFNFDLAGSLVEHFTHQDQICLDLLADYQRDFTGYLLTTEIVHHIAAQRGGGATATPPENIPSGELCSKLTVKLAIDVTTHSLKYVEEVWKTLVRRSQLPKHTLLLWDIAESSLMITWLFPKSKAAELTEAILGNTHELRLKRVYLVTIDEIAVYSTDLEALNIDAQLDWQDIYEGSAGEALVTAARMDSVDLDVNNSKDKTHYTFAVEETREQMESAEVYTAAAYSGPFSFTLHDLSSTQLQWGEDVVVPIAAVEESEMPALFQALCVGTTPRNPNHVPYFDREPSSKQVAMKIKALQRKFARLGILAHRELKDVPLPEIRIFIKSISADEKESIPLYSQSMVEMLTTTSVEEVISLCSRIGVWDFYNFQVLEDVAVEFRCSTLQQKLAEYTAEVEDFKSDTKLSDFLRVWSGRTPHGSIPDCEPVIVKVKKHWPNYTLKDVAEFEGYLAKEFKVRQLVFKLSNAREGCVSLMWLVPKSAIAVMQAAMQKMSKRRLKELNIQLLCIGKTLYKVSEEEDFFSLYEESLVKGESFWGVKAKQLLSWSREFDKVLDYDEERAIMQWFSGGKLNVSENCLDRHVAEDPNRTAIIWERDEPNKEQRISYSQLLSMTCQIANVLKSKGVHKGDSVLIYMPAMPLVIASMLACARIGAVHCVVFAKTDREELQLCIRDTKATVVITANDRVVGGKSFTMKENLDRALQSTNNVHTVLVASRTTRKPPMDPRRDYCLEEEMSKQSTECPPEPMDSEDDLFIMYTSGTSGKVKGIVHTQAGYLLYATFSLQFTFDYKQGDIFGCVADPGWILGHSYVVYGPLCLGGTSVLYESTATYPHHDRYWRMIERLKITQFITTPHVLKNLKNCADTHDIMKSCNLSSLKSFTLLGEPLSDDLWNWFGQRLDCCMMDTWWQTELGGTAITRWSTRDGSTPPGFPDRKSYAFFGVEPYLEKEEKKGREAKGHLFLKKPIPGMGRRINRVSQEDYKQLYFRNGAYDTYDEAERDTEGGYRIIGRVDNSVRTKGIWLSISTMESTIDDSDSNIRESLVVTCQSKDTDDKFFMVAFLELKKPAESFSKREKKSVVDNAKNAVFTRLGADSVPQEFAIVECLEKTKTKKSMRSYLQDVVEHRQEMFRKRSLSTPGTDEQEIPEYNSSYLRHEKLKHVKRLSLPSLSPECGRHLSDAAQALHLST